MSDEICHSCPRRADCMLAAAETPIDRCTYHQHAREAEAAFARMAASRINRQMLGRVVSAIALETGQTPRQVRERLHQGGIRQ